MYLALLQDAQGGPPPAATMSPSSAAQASSENTAGSDRSPPTSVSTSRDRINHSNFSAAQLASSSFWMSPSRRGPEKHRSMPPGRKPWRAEAG